MEPIHPNLIALWKSYGVTDEEIEEYEQLLHLRFGAMDTDTRNFYAEKIKNCRLCRQYFFVNHQ